MKTASEQHERSAADKDSHEYALFSASKRPLGMRENATAAAAAAAAACRMTTSRILFSFSGHNAYQRNSLKRDSELVSSSNTYRKLTRQQARAPIGQRW